MSGDEKPELRPELVPGYGRASLLVAVIGHLLVAAAYAGISG